MDVRIIEARRPLPVELTSVLTDMGGEAVDWRTSTGVPSADGSLIDIDQFGSEGARPDAATWDTPRDHGFNDHPVAAAIQPTPGSVSGSGFTLRTSSGLLTCCSGWSMRETLCW